MTTSFRLGPVRVDLTLLIVHRPDGSQALTPLEAAVLEHLRAANGAPVSARTLLTEVWNYDPSVKSRTATVTTHRLRAKLELDPSDPQHLITIRGQGFVLQGAVEETVDAVQRSLFGRVSELEQAERRWTGLLTICGPVGVGKTALARELAPANALWVDADGVTTDTGIFAALVRSAPTPLPPTLDAAVRVLALREGPVVLDGLAPGVLQAALPRLCAHTRILVTSRGPCRVPSEAVLNLAPLQLPDRVAMLHAESERLGFSVEPRVLRAVAVRIDGLPLEVSIAAPLVGLFGTDAVAMMQKSLQPILREAISRLEPQTRAFLDHVAVFHSSFRVQAAAAIAGCTLPVAATALQSLLGRGLLTHHDAGFRVLRSLRTWVSPPTTAEAALHAWCLDLHHTALQDGGETGARHAEDLRWAAARAESDDADALSLALYDVACLRGPMVDFTASLDHLATLGAEGPRNRALVLALALGRDVDPAELTALRARAEAGSLEAAAVGLLTKAAREHDDSTLEWQALALRGHAPLEIQARMLPGLMCWNRRPEVRERLGGLAHTCKARGWTTAHRASHHALLTCLLVQGSAAAVLAAEIEPGHDDIASRISMTRAAAALSLGDGERAVLEAIDAQRSASRTMLDAVLLEALGHASCGRSPREALAKVDASFATGIAADLHRALSGWPTVRVQHAALVDIQALAAIPQGRLAGRLSLGFAGYCRNVRAEGCGRPAPTRRLR